MRGGGRTGNESHLSRVILNTILSSSWGRKRSLCLSPTRCVHMLIYPQEEYYEHTGLTRPTFCTNYTLYSFKEKLAL